MLKFIIQYTRLKCLTYRSDKIFIHEMKRKTFLISLTLAIILVCQATNGFAEREKVVTVKTQSGSFPLPIPILRLPEIPLFPLVSVSDVVFPELPRLVLYTFYPRRSQLA